MKNINSRILIIVIACYSSAITGIEYKQATKDDVKGIVELINTHAYHDSDKIVIVPEKFRAGYVHSAIDAGRLFVATHDQQIIGYKKLFCITDANELDDILSNELRCKGVQPVVCSNVAVNDLSCQHVSSDNIVDLVSAQATYIYNGADFTHPNYRGMGVNSQLTQYALNVISQTLIGHIKDHKSTHLAMAYGLTQSNAGKETDVLDGRTHGIVKQFVPFVQSIAKAVNATSPSTMLLGRYCAFKPSFDPNATECIPLPDQKAIPGYGCLMMCTLDHTTQ